VLATRSALKESKWNGTPKNLNSLDWPLVKKKLWKGGLQVHLDGKGTVGDKEKTKARCLIRGTSVFLRRPNIPLDKGRGGVNKSIRKSPKKKNCRQGRRGGMKRKKTNSKTPIRYASLKDALAKR